MNERYDQTVHDLLNLCQKVNDFYDHVKGKNELKGWGRIGLEVSRGQLAESG